MFRKVGGLSCRIQEDIGESVETTNCRLENDITDPAASKYLTTWYVIGTSGY